MTTTSPVSRVGDFQRKFTILSDAAVGVTVCRTREPFRVSETMFQLCLASGTDYHRWSLSNGWCKFTSETNTAQEPDGDGLADPLNALRKIDANDNSGFGDGVFLMIYPHWVLPRNPVMIQIVKEYCRKFTSSDQRLIMVVPPGFTLPQELEDDVVILDFDVPDQAELGTFLARVMGSITTEEGEAIEPFSDEDTHRILSAGAGMTSHEFESSVSRAIVELRDQFPAFNADDFVQIILDTKTEVIKRSECLELLKSDSIENVGGLDHLKAWVAKRKACFSPEAKEFGIEAPKGIALIGPPGTGKSLAAKAISAVLGQPTIRFDVSRIFQSLVGASEGRMRTTLKMVEAMAPCVLLVDEIDKSIQANSGGMDSGVGQRVLGILLTWMQETEAPVFLVVTANRVDNLPAELLRKGRLDEVFAVTVPSEAERLEVLKIHLRKRGHDPETIEDLNEALERSAGFTPAECEAAIKEALIEAYSASAPLTGHLIAEQFGNMTPLAQGFAEQFSAMSDWASANARPAGAGAVEQAAAVRRRSRPTAGGRSINLNQDTGDESGPAMDG